MKLSLKTTGARRHCPHNLSSFLIDKEQLLCERVCRYRKGHSTVTTLLGIKDMIRQAMGRSEVTLMILAHFSKVFDTIDYKTHRNLDAYT